MDRPQIAVLNGPNLNLLGERQPEVYGRETLGDVEKRCVAHAERLGYDVDFRQSNHEGVLVDAIHQLRHVAAGFVINAGAYTHTSVALRDALACVKGPSVEVHVSNVHAREPFRHHSYLSDICLAVIVGCGVQGYEFAISVLATHVDGARR
jgi:3-dehydroquinate dehydratase II